jgi:hypothetical protein
MEMGIGGCDVRTATMQSARGSKKNLMYDCDTEAEFLFSGLRTRQRDVRRIASEVSLSRICSPLDFKSTRSPSRVLHEAGRPAQFELSFFQSKAASRIQLWIEQTGLRRVTDDINV